MKTLLAGGLLVLIACSSGLTGCRDDLGEESPYANVGGSSDAGADVVDGDAAEPEFGEMLSSESPRNMSPDATTEEIKELVAGNTAFAFDLYPHIAQSGGNLFYSPYSISQAMVMAWAGAVGAEQQAMAAALHLTLPPDRIHVAFNALDLALASRGQDASSTEMPFKLHNANAAWGQKGQEYYSSYLDTLGINYGAGLRLLDFASDPGGAAKVINEWASWNTNGLIDELVDAQLVRDRLLVLTNAIYFRASWINRFGLAEPRSFWLLDGSQIDAPMMSGQTISYAEGDGWAATIVPYDGEDVDMILLVPDRGRFSEIEGQLDAEFLAAALGSMGAYATVYVYMPPFQVDARYALGEVLGQLNALQPLFGIATDEEVWIHAVNHVATVKLDEEGTEAAAATAVVGGPPISSEPIEIRSLNANRPFLFFIRDKKTRSILFAGRVLDPREH